MHRLRLVVLIAFVSAAFASSAGAASLAQAAAPEACGLITLDEANKATGRNFQRARPGKGQGDSGTTCDFISGVDGTLILTLSDSSKKDHDTFRQLLVRQGQKLEAVPGLGDDAYFWDDRINVLSGTRLVVIFNGDPMQPSAKVRPMVLALARLAVTKLK